MKIHSTRTLHGPNVYHHLPVVLMTVELEEWTDIPSTDIPNFAANLLQLLPGLQTHHCSRHHEGGLVERLNEGTYMAHIIEHIALELSVLTGIEATYGKTRYAGATGRYEIVTRFQHEEGMKECLRQALDLAQAAATSQKFSLEEALKDIRREISRTKLGPSAQALWDAAKKKKIPCRRLGNNSLLQLGYGKKMKRIQAAVTDQTSLIASDIAQDKSWTKELLKDAFLPVPKGFVIETEFGLQDAIENLSTPFVVKPFNGNHGNGVTLNLKNFDEAKAAFEVAKKYSPQILVEEMCQGKDYRVLVVNGKLVAAAERQPPFVIGDGERSIEQLITEMNEDPRRGNGHENVLSKIQVDEVMIAYLAKKGLTVESVLPAGAKATLRANANLSSGGTATDVTEIVHPQIAALCERASRVVGLDICGIDLIQDEISNPVNASTKIIELNAGPGLRMHLSPSEGKARAVAEPIVEMLFPKEEQGRIPILSVTGTNGKTTTVRMLHKIFSEPGDICVGLTTTDGIWMGSERIFSGDTTGPKSSQVVLSDPKVDMAILEVARGGLLRGGLAYDWSDVSVITNVRPDHIGQDGIEDLEDLVWIKSVVAERVKENGVLVLNADDEASLSLKDHPRVMKTPKRIFLYSIEAQNPNLLEHRLAGGSACWVEKDWVYITHGDVFGRVLRVSEIPATMNGLADFQISNMLGAISAAFAQGASFEQIANGLKAFQPLHENMGRMNLYQVHGGYVLLDYGHNGDALTAIGRMLSKLPGYRKTAILSMPGDRSDHLIESGGQAIAERFDRFFLKDDEDLRGRPSGQTPDLIRKGILAQNPQALIQILPSENEAMLKALHEIRPGEIVVVFYEKFSTVMATLLQFDPVPVAFIPELPFEEFEVNQPERHAELQHAVHF